MRLLLKYLLEPVLTHKSDNLKPPPKKKKKIRISSLQTIDGTSFCHSKIYSLTLKT